MMSGGALSECTLFALGVQPAINASIIMQLLAVAIPYLENLTKEGEEGQRKMRRITNYVGAGIGLMLSIGYYFIIRNMGALSYTEGFAGIFSAVVIVLAFTAGSQLCAWMGNQIDTRVSATVSLMIFAGIVARWSSIYTATTNILARARTVSRSSTSCCPAGCPGSGRCGLRRHPDERRAPHPGPVRQARYGPQDVWWSGQLHPHQGQHDRRYAHHLCLDAVQPARSDLPVHQSGSASHPALYALACLTTTPFFPSSFTCC